MEEEKWRQAPIKVVSDSRPWGFEQKVNELLEEGWRKESPARVVEAAEGGESYVIYAVVLFKPSEED